MKDIREKIEEFVEKSNCSTNSGLIEELDLKLNRITALLGVTLQVLNDSSRVTDNDIEKILDIFVW